MNVNSIHTWTVYSTLHQATVLWVVTLCTDVVEKDGGSMVLKNVGIHFTTQYDNPENDLNLHCHKNLISCILYMKFHQNLSPDST
jgi:hypothetical protein